MYFCRLVLIVTLFILPFWSSAQNIISATHETDNQLQVTIVFDSPPSAVAGDYVLNGGAIPVAGVFVAGNTAFVSLPLGSPIPIGISSFPIQYAPSGSNGISNNNRVLVCTDFSWFATNTPTLPCAPVDPVNKMVFSVLPGARNSSQWGVQPLSIRVDWTGGTSFLAPYESDNSGNTAINTNFISVDAALDGFQYPDNQPECSYNSRWRPRLGTFGCPVANPNQVITYASHNEDNEGNGVLNLEPLVPNTDLVCFNDEIDMSFSDVSILNCINDPDQPHTDTRWVRVIYGDATRSANDRIPNVYVGGIQVTDATGGLMAGEYIPTNGGATAALGMGDVIGVVEFDDPINQLPAGALDQITTIMTVGESRNVGDRFYVTIEYWNVCNAYTVGNPLNNQVTTQAFIEIIDIPPPPTDIPDEICEGDGLGGVNFAIAGTAGSTAINWYDNDPGAGGNLVANPNGNNSTTFPANSFPGGLNTNVPGEYSMWATYVLGATNSCESDPVEVVITVREDLNQPGTITGATQVCEGASGLSYTLPAAAGSTTLGGPVEYEWDVTGGGGVTITPTSADGQSVDIDFNIGGSFTSVTRNIRVRRIYSSNPTCPSNRRTLTVTIFGPTVGGTTNPDNEICVNDNTGTITLSGENGSILRWERSFNAGGFVDIGNGGSDTFDENLTVAGTYEYRAIVENGVCTTEESTVTTIVVNPFPTTPTINPNPTVDICEDGSTTLTAISNAAANSFQWYRDNVALGGETNSTITLGTVAQSGSYTVEAIGVAPTNCTSARSSPTIVTINPLPTASVTGGGSVCDGGLNPAPDIVWTLTGSPPFDFTITRPVAAGPTINETGFMGTSYTISAPTVGGNYEMTLLEDDNGCIATSLGGPVTVSIIATASPSITTYSAGAAVCDDGATTVVPSLFLDLLPNSVQTYDITYTIEDGANNVIATPTINVTTNANGETSIPVDYVSDLGSMPDTYEFIITSIVNTVTLCNASGLPSSEFVTINPIPPVPTNPTSGIACSSDPNGATISVDDPGAGNIIVWYTDNSPPTTLAVGVTGGTGGRAYEFTPNSTATVTYYAVTESQTAPTNCQSAPVAVEHIEDTEPATPEAGPAQDDLCSGTATLAADAPMANGSGTWTILGQVVYQQNFENNTVYPIGTSSSTAANGWSIDVSAPNAFPQNGPGGFFEVRAGKRFEANNTNGNLGGGAGNVGEVAWFSEIVDISSLTSVDASVDMFDVNGGLDNEDYYNVYYRLNAGPETLFTTLGSQINDFPDQTASVTGLSGSTLQIVIRIATTAGTETIAFDNVIVRETGSNVAFDDPNSNSAMVTGLVQNTPGGAPIVYTARWTIQSQFGACAPEFDDVNLTVNPLPTAIDPTPNLCEDVAGTERHANEDLTLYNTAVTDAPTVEWYSSPLRTAPFLISTPVTIENGVSDVFYFRATGPAPGSCTNVGQITFTVDPLPDAANQAAQICEDSPGALEATGINLQSYELAIANGSLVDRDVEWYEDAALTMLIPPGALPGAEENYSINADVTLHARIIDTSSPVTPQCFSQATLTLDYQPRPNDNQITDGIGQIVGATYTACASENLVLLQIDNSLNPGTDYNWSVPPVSYPGEFELLSTTDNFFIILRLPNSFDPQTWNAGTTYGIGDIVTDGVRRYESLVAGNLGNTPNVSPGQWNDLSPVSLYGGGGGLPISVTETIGTALCDGNTLTTNIFVDASPPRPIIAGPTSVCSGENGVVFSVTNPVAGTYSWSLPPGATITSLPVTASTITVQMSSFSGNVGVTHASGIGCTSPPADPYGVTVVDRPNITSSGTAILCSGVNVSTAHTLMSDIVSTTYNWQVINVTGFVGGTLLGDSDNGVLSINQTLTNTSGVTGSVVYQVTPIGPAPDNCPGTPENLTVTVEPQPVIAPGQIKTICSGDNVDYDVLLSPLGLPANTEFSWLAPTMSAGGPQGTAGNNVPESSPVTINDVLVNLTNAPITATYSITPTVNGGLNCTTLPPVDVVITIDPEPLFTGDLDVTVCSDVITGVALPGTDDDGGAITSYDISAVVGAGLIGTATTATGTANVNEILNDSFTNTTSAPIDVVYTVTPYRNACAGTAFTITVTIDIEPVFTGDLNAIVCSDDPVGVALPSTDDDGDAITSYDVTAAVGAGLTGTATTATGTTDVNLISGDAFTNVGNAPVDVVYTVTPYIGLCDGTPFTITIEVDPEPVFTGNLNTTVCSDEVTGVTLPLLDDDGDAITSYDVSAVVGAGLTGTATTATGTTDINLIGGDSFENVTNASLSVVYTVTPYIGNCDGTPFNITVTIDQEPLFTGDLDVTVCSDVITGVALPGTDDDGGAITSYDISAVVGAGLIGTATTATGTANVNEILNDSFTNTTNGPIDVVYTITPYRNACAGTAFTITVTIDIEPLFTGDLDATVCSDAALGVTLPLMDDDGDAIASYDVTAAVGAGLTGTATTATGTTDVNLISGDAFTNVGNAPVNVVYTVTPYIGLCDGTPFTITIEVDPEPVFTGNLNTTVCSDEVTGVTLPLLDDDGDAITSYDVSAVVGAGLTGTATTATGTTDINLIGGDSFENVTNASSNVVYTVTPYIGNCDGTPFNITVTIDQEPLFTGDLDVTVCSDVIMGVVLPGTDDDGGAITSYDISAVVGAGLIGTATTATGTANVNEILNDSFTNTTNGPIDVVYTITPYRNACDGTSFTITVTIDIEPVFTGDLDATVCSDAALGVTLPSMDDDGDAIASYDVTAAVGAGLTGTATTATGTTDVNLISGDAFTNVGNAPVNVVYTVTPYIGLCDGTPFTITIEVDPEPVFTGNLNTTVCSDQNIGVIIPNADDDAGTITSFDVAATVGAGLTGTATTGNNQANVNLISGDAFENLSNLPIDVVYTVTPYFGVCPGTSFNITVTIDPEPVFTGDLDVTVCSDDLIGVVLPGVDDDGNGITSYDVTAAVGAGLTGIPTTATGTTNVNLISGDAFNNIQGDPVDVVYTVIPYIGTCRGEDFTITVTVGEEPVFTGNLNNTVCSDEISSIVLPAMDDSGDAITSFDISAVVSGALTGAASTGTGITDVNQINNDSFTNTSNNAANVVYTVTPYIGLCDGTSFTITLTVTPESVFTGVLDVTRCSDEVIGVILPGADDDGDPITTYDVTAVVGAGLTGTATVATGTSDVNLIASDQFNNVTSSSIDVVYTVTPYRNGCEGATFDITVTVSPEPVFTGNLNATVCSDQAIGITLPSLDDSGDAITSYDVTASVGGNLTGTPTTATGTTDVNLIAGDMFNNISSASDIVTYTVTPYIGLCAGTPFDIEVTIDQEPLYTGNLNTTVCSDEITGIILPATDNDGNAITEFNIGAILDPGVTGVASIGNGVTNLNFITNDVFNNVTNNSADVTYTLIPFIGSCEGSSFNIVVTVNPEPLFTGILDNTVCSDEVIGITLPATDDDGGSITSFDIAPVVSGGLIGTANSGIGLTDVTSIFNDSFTNPTATSLTVTYTITPYTNGCEGAQFVITATVDPEPVFTGVLDRTICSGGNVGVTLPGTDDSGDAITSYDVTAVVHPNLGGVASVGSGVVDVNLINFDTYNNITNQSEDVVYTITPYIGACEGNPFDIVITVDPEPVFTASLDAMVCSDDITGIVLPTTDDDGRLIDSFDVSAVVGAGLSGIATTAVGTTNRNLILNNVFENTTNMAHDVVYTVVPYFGNCPGASFTITVTINPKPVLAANPSANPAPVCSDLVSGITLGQTGTSVTAGSFNITGISVTSGLIPGGTNSTIQDGVGSNAIANDSYTNTTNNPLTVTYTIAPVSALGCVGDSEQIIFTINPAPALADLNAVVCSGETSEIQLATALGSASAQSYDILDIRPDAGLAVVSMALLGIVSDIDHIRNDVFINDGSTNPPSDPDPPLTVEYDIVPISSAGCRGPLRTIVLTIEPQPTVEPIADEDICSSDLTSILLESQTSPTSGDVTFVVQATTTDAIIGFTPFRQNLPRGTLIEDVPVNLDNTVGTITYTITPQLLSAKNGIGCRLGTPRVVTVRVEPQPRLEFTNTFITICEGESLDVLDNFLITPTIPSMGNIEFVLNGAVATGGVTGFSTSGIYSPGQEIVDVLDNPTIFNQTLTYTFTPRAAGTNAGNCVGSDVSLTVTVTPRPTVTPDPAVLIPSVATPTVELCSGESRIIGLSTDVANTISQWTVSDNPNVEGQFESLGSSLFLSLINTSTDPQTLTYTITPFSLFDNTCTGDPITIDVIVNPTPQVTIADPEPTRCDGEETGIVLDGPTLGSTFNWEAEVISGNVTLLNSTGTGDNGDVITDILTNNGTTPAIIRYTIRASYNKFYTNPMDPIAVCDGLLPGFVTLTLSPAVNASIVPDPDVGTATRYRCTGDTEAIRFSLSGAAPFELTLDKTENGVTTRETLTDLPSQHIILATESVSYTIVEVIDNNNCKATSTDFVDVVFEDALADFTINGSKNPSAVTLDFNTGTATVDINLNAYDPANSYQMQIGDSTFTPPGARFQYTFTEPSPFGSVGFVAELIVVTQNAFNCNSVESFFIQVIPAEATVLGTSDVVEGCAPLAVNFESFRDDLSLSRNVIVEQLTWDFGDGTPSLTNPNPTHTFTQPGAYNVIVRGSNGYPGSGNEGQFSITINVLDNPVADFRSNQNVVFIPDQSFRPINNSFTPLEEQTNWTWDWGDGSISSGPNEFAADHVYDQEGEYYVTLTVSVDYGNGVVCTDAVIDTVQVEEGGFTRTPNAFTPSLNGPRGGSFDPLSPGTAGEINDVFLPITEGVDEFQMVIFDRWGNLIFESNDKTIGWDGYDSKGKLLPAGVYVYRLDLLLSDGNRTTRVGDVTLIR